MKYGILFCTLSFVLTVSSFTLGGWLLLLLWPAVAVGIVGVAYFGRRHWVFGKRPSGLMSPVSVAVLMPYLLFLWTIWHLIRVMSREPAYDTVADGLVIGRRLLSSEFPDGIRTVVDLTCEFVEPAALRTASTYIAAPMLDASVLAPQQLADTVDQIVVAEAPIYIHCAQGHGRTGVVAALVLIALGDAADPDEALAILQAARPLVGVNRLQRAALDQAAKMIETHTES